MNIFKIINFFHEHSHWKRHQYLQRILAKNSKNELEKINLEFGGKREYFCRRKSRKIISTDKNKLKIRLLEKGKLIKKSRKFGYKIQTPLNSKLKQLK